MSVISSSEIEAGRAHAEILYEEKALGRSNKLMKYSFVLMS